MIAAGASLWVCGELKAWHSSGLAALRADRSLWQPMVGVTTTPPTIFRAEYPDFLALSTRAAVAVVMPTRLDKLCCWSFRIIHPSINSSILIACSKVKVMEMKGSLRRVNARCRGCVVRWRLLANGYSRRGNFYV